MLIHFRGLEAAIRPAKQQLEVLDGAVLEQREQRRERERGIGALAEICAEHVDAQRGLRGRQEVEPVERRVDRASS